MELKGVLVLFAASLISLSTAQCTGTLTNATMNVSLSWQVLTGNTVHFVFSAPSNEKQFTILVFTDSNETMTLSEELTGDLVFASYKKKAEGTYDRWLGRGLSVEKDTQQDLTDFHLQKMGGNLVVNFTRPILSSDKTQDIDIDTRRYLGWGYGGYVPFVTKQKRRRYHFPKYFGFFDTPMCLKRCEIVKSYNPSTSSSAASTSFVGILVTSILAVVTTASVVAV